MPTPDPYGPPLATQQSNLAQDALSAISRDHRLESERYAMLVSQAERIRLTLFSLTRIGERMRRQEGGTDPASIVRRALELSANLLQAVAGQFQDRPLPGSTTAWLEEVQQAAGTLRNAASASGQTALAPAIRDARSHVDALAGQLRAALDLAQRDDAGR